MHACERTQADVSINAANWNLLTTVAGDGSELGDEAGAKDKEPEGGDDMWKSFQSIAEQKQVRGLLVTTTFLWSVGRY